MNFQWMCCAERRVFQMEENLFSHYKHIENMSNLSKSISLYIVGIFARRRQVYGLKMDGDSNKTTNNITILTFKVKP